jgi:ribosomal protein L34E
VTAAEATGEGGRSGGPGESRCARCGAPFHCGIDDAGGCWCARLPPLSREDYAAAAGCLCEQCLRAAVVAAAAPGGGPAG